MDIWINRLSESEALVQSSIDSLNSYATSANSATSQEDWQKYKDLYDAEETKYNNNLEIYNQAYDDAVRYVSNRRVISTTYQLPNAKDRDEWLAGGYFKNQSFAGGVLWSPTSMPSIGISPNG